MFPEGRGVGRSRNVHPDDVHPGSEDSASGDEFLHLDTRGRGQEHSSQAMSMQHPLHPHGYASGYPTSASASLPSTSFPSSSHSHASGTPHGPMHPIHPQSMQDPRQGHGYNPWPTTGSLPRLRGPLDPFGMPAGPFSEPHPQAPHQSGASPSASGSRHRASQPASGMPNPVDQMAVPSAGGSRFGHRSSQDERKQAAEWASEGVKYNEIGRRLEYHAKSVAS
jgi:hypothetical protein